MFHCIQRTFVVYSNRYKSNLIDDRKQTEKFILIQRCFSLPKLQKQSSILTDWGFTLQLHKKELSIGQQKVLDVSAIYKNHNQVRMRWILIWFQEGQESDANLLHQLTARVFVHIKTIGFSRSCLSINRHSTVSHQKIKSVFTNYKKNRGVLAVRRYTPLNTP